MSFTDEELYRMKSNLAVEIPDDGEIHGYSLLVDELKALLARLEAAEAYAMECRELGADDTKLYNAWLKSKGAPGDE